MSGVTGKFNCTNKGAEAHRRQTEVGIHAASIAYTKGQLRREIHGNSRKPESHQRHSSEGFRTSWSGQTEVEPCIGDAASRSSYPKA
jgi:hypothetical protein